jgi:HPt (histidine-containing phosphotransfer) domain-containing protein
MLGFFIEMFPAEIYDLTKAVANGTGNEIREVAQRAKSAAANVAAPALTALLQNIEDRAANGELEGLSDFLGRVQVEFRRIEAYSHRS